MISAQLRWHYRVAAESAPALKHVCPILLQPYLFPLTGPVSGLSLTDETTLPFPHHRSLFFGCDRVNGGNYWQEGCETGQILSAGPKLSKQARDQIVITDSCDWQKPGGPVIMKDDRTLTITVPSDKLRLIQWVITLKAVEAIIVQKTNHSLLSMRAALDITPKGGGNLVNAEGITGEKGTAGVKSAWCDFYGRRATMPDVVEGIAIFDHPRNLWAPTPWFTRDYGFASPTPLNFMEKPWTIAPGNPVTFRYALVLHAGDPAIRSHRRHLWLRPHRSRPSPRRRSTAGTCRTGSTASARAASRLRMSKPAIARRPFATWVISLDGQAGACAGTRSRKCSWGTPRRTSTWTACAVNPTNFLKRSEPGCVPSKGRFLARMKFSSPGLLTGEREPTENMTISLTGPWLCNLDGARFRFDRGDVELESS